MQEDDIYSNTKCRHHLGQSGIEQYLSTMGNGGSNIDDIFVTF